MSVGVPRRALLPIERVMTACTELKRTRELKKTKRIHDMVRQEINEKKRPPSPQLKKIKMTRCDQRYPELLEWKKER